MHSSTAVPDIRTMRLDNVSPTPVARYVPLVLDPDHPGIPVLPLRDAAVPTPMLAVVGCTHDPSGTPVATVAVEQSGDQALIRLSPADIDTVLVAAALAPCGDPVLVPDTAAPTAVAPATDKTGRNCPGAVLPWMLVTADGRILATGPLDVLLPCEWSTGWISRSGLTPALIESFGIKVHYEGGKDKALLYNRTKSYTKGTVVLLPDGSYAVAGCDIAPGGPIPGSDQAESGDAAEDGSVSVDGDAGADSGGGDGGGGDGGGAAG